MRPNDSTQVGDGQRRGRDGRVTEAVQESCALGKFFDAPQWCVHFPFVVDRAVGAAKSGISCRENPLK
ncbi:hypothetical protein [Pseudoxanthomonas sp. GM95]|uniref:hypothetical protein n=1 Tax=Pseudoxanthomonas sp. GM95 TaxID=1881043 RepID=UPI001114533A|nr:hypothetical protein [Pseudoxanthomonas sp. GM95]